MYFRFSCPNTSSQNGKAERMLRTLNNSTRTMLIHASVPYKYWPHALLMASYLHNILPSKPLNFISPTQALYLRIPTYFHLRVFGCLCYPNLTSTTCHKLQPRSTECVFLGFSSNHRGYKCLDLSSNKIILSRHVIFDETSFPFSRLHKPSPQSYDFLTDESSPYLTHFFVNDSLMNNNYPPANTTNPESPPSSPLTDTPTSTSSSYGSPTPPPPPPTNNRSMVTRSQHGIFKPKKHFNLSSNTIKMSPLPKSHLTALQDHNWKLAMTNEYNALIKNKTWDLVPRPPM